MATAMNGLSEFLQASTIHGLSYIGSSKVTFLRIFWTSVVAFGFATAAYLILGSISSWEESPIISTTQTKPISNANFPEITVCPPAGTNTALNYDIFNTVNKTLDEELRSNLLSNIEHFVIEEYYNLFTYNMNAYTDIEIIKDFYAT